MRAFDIVSSAVTTGLPLSTLTDSFAWPKSFVSSNASGSACTV